jgi:hypothetical protein
MLLNRKLAKSVSAVSGLKPASAKAAVHSPAEIVQGIHRYTKLYGAVYSVYRETTKKYIGLALYDGKEFTPCTPTELIHAIHESKDGK